MRQARVLLRAGPSALWWTKDNGSIIAAAPCAALYLWLKESEGAGGAAMTVDWTPEGVEDELGMPASGNKAFR